VTKDKWFSSLSECINIRNGQTGAREQCVKMGKVPHNTQWTGQTDDHDVR
jgi:hypothetical protein